MTQHVGYFCPHCGIRYVAHVCDAELQRLPCKHDFRDAFYTFQWDYSGGYKRFIVRNIHHGVCFDVRYMDDEGFKDAMEGYVLWLEFLVEANCVYLFVKDKSVIDIFKEACDHAGGQGCQYPPRWRCKELDSAREKVQQLKF